jgi:hypothetical protein
MRKVSLMVAGVAVIAALTGAGLPASAATGPDTSTAAQAATTTADTPADVTPLYSTGFYIWDGTYRCTATGP